MVTALRGSFNIWQKKYRYTSPMVNKPNNTRDWIMNTDDYSNMQIIMLFRKNITNSKFSYDYLLNSMSNEAILLKFCFWYVFKKNSHFEKHVKTFEFLDLPYNKIIFFKPDLLLYFKTIFIDICFQISSKNLQLAQHIQLWTK
jgi:hypothetical protein